EGPAILVGDRHEAVRLMERCGVPAGRHPRREQRLRLRGEDDGPVTDRVEERLDPEAITRREERLVRLVPERERELTAQMMEALRAAILVQMQRDLAVRTRAQPVTTRIEHALDAPGIGELSTHDEAQ